MARGVSVVGDGRGGGRGLGVRPDHHVVGAQQPTAQQLLEGAGGRLEQDAPDDAGGVRVLRDDPLLQEALGLAFDPVGRRHVHGDRHAAAELHHQGGPGADPSRVARLQEPRRHEEGVPAGRARRLHSRGQALRRADDRRDLQPLPQPETLPGGGPRSRQGLSAYLGGHRPDRPEAREDAGQHDDARGLRLRDALLRVCKNTKEWYDKTSYPYPSANFLELPGMDEARKTRYLDVFIGDIKTGTYVTRTAYYLEISDAMHRAMERVVLKNEDPKASLDQACKEIDAALAKP